MSLNGTKVTKLILRLAVIVFIAFCVLMLFSVIIDKQRNSSYNVSEVYYEEILELLETTNEFTLNDIFDFDFDRAYVVDMHEVYGDEEYFVKKTGAFNTVNIISLNSEGYNRILFLSNDEIVFDFIYSTLDINFTQTGLWILPDTEINKVSQLDEQIILQFE